MLRANPLRLLLRSTPSLTGAGSRAPAPVLPGEGLSARRRIFSNSYLGVDSFVRRRNSMLLTLGDGEPFVGDIRATFADSGIRNLFSDDLDRLVHVAASEEDVRLASDVLRSSLREAEAGGRPISNLPRYLATFFSLCRADGRVEAARDMWNSEELAASKVGQSMRSVRLRYVSLLLSEGLHQEVADTYRQLGHSGLSNDDVTILLAALYRMGTDEAYREASEFMYKPGPFKSGAAAAGEEDEADLSLAEGSKERLGRPGFGGRGRSRGAFIYAHFSVLKGEYGTAYDMLSDRRFVGAPSRLSSNLKLLILAEVRRLREALQLIRSELLLLPEAEGGRRGGRPRGREVCFEVMQKLAKAIKEDHDPASDVAKEFASLCRVLDDSAILCEKSVEELIFEPIQPHFIKEGKRSKGRGFHERDSSREHPRWSQREELE